MILQSLVYVILSLLAFAFGAGSWAMLLRIMHKEINGLGARVTRIDHRQMRMIALLAFALEKAPDFRKELLELLEDQ